jgi:cytochrome b
MDENYEDICTNFIHEEHESFMGRLEALGVPHEDAFNVVAILSAINICATIRSTIETKHKEAMGLMLEQIGDITTKAIDAPIDEWNITQH